MTRDEYGELYERGFTRTVRMLRGRGATLVQAEDLAQTAWLQGWRKLDQLRDEALLLGWINTIAINFQRRDFRRESRYEVLSGLEVSVNFDFDSTPLDIAKILKTSRSRDRMLFEQHLGGMTLQEIADQLGISATAARIRFWRARHAVRRSLRVREPVRLPLPRGLTEVAAE